ncbi:MAG: CHC2 zinc finger domain-containing protein [Flavisolibacter sp.]
MYPSNLNASEIKQQVSLVDLLTSLGYKPAKSAGRELLYVSMLRDTDSRPSFSVNKELNVWYDHGTAKGGNIIDFAMAYWKLDFIEALKKIASVSDLSLSPIHVTEKRVRKHALKIPHYCIEEVMPLGSNPIITEYVTGRGVWEAAKTLLYEVYYYVEDEQKNRKKFFAAGWQNELGSWEVRNLYFKGCLGHKAITFIGRDENSLSVFEGCFNYLSWLTENPFALDSILILNSATLLESAIRKAKDFAMISIFFDRDQIGEQASANFLRALPQAIDQSARYQDYNDYNEMLISHSGTIHKVSRGT